MFERLTDEARRSVVLAQEEARALQHDYIGTEHLLLGLLHTGEGMAVDVLQSQGVSLGDVRAQVTGIVGSGEADPQMHLRFTQRAKKVLELSLRESLQLGHQSITAGHLLLGILREGEGVGARALMELGVDMAAVRGRVMEAFAAEEAAPERRGGLSRRTLRRSQSVGEAPRGEERPVGPRPWALERLDDSAWHALGAARNCARQRDATAVGTIDLLSGVAGVAGPGAEVLRAMDVDLDALHAAVHAMSGNRADAPSALPFTAAARMALTWAADEATGHEHTAATTAHILLALATGADAELAAVLDDLGISTSEMQIAAARHLDIQ